MIHVEYFYTLYLSLKIYLSFSETCTASKLIISKEKLGASEIYFVTPITGRKRSRLIKCRSISRTSHVVKSNTCVHMFTSPFLISALNHSYFNVCFPCGSRLFGVVGLICRWFLYLILFRSNQ